MNDEFESVEVTAAIGVFVEVTAPFGAFVDGTSRSHAARNDAARIPEDVLNKSRREKYFFI